MSKRLDNLEKLYHVPVFALRGLLESRIPGRNFGQLRRSELVAEADRLSAISPADVEALYENYRYGQRLSFYLYLLPDGLPTPAIEDIQDALDALGATEHPDLADEIIASEDYETEASPSQVILLDEDRFEDIREIRFRYFVVHRFLNADEEPDQILQTRYGFFWLDLSLGYLVILCNDERINSLLVLALSLCLQAIPLSVRFPKELVDKHLSIEKVKRVSHYDPGTGVRQSISGQGLWKTSEREILARERNHVRPSSLYEEEVAAGVTSGLGVTASKGKIYLTKALPTSMLRTWALQRLPDLVRDLKELRTRRPGSFALTIDEINRIRLPLAGKAAIGSIVEALLQADREDLTSVDLPQTAMAIYGALKGKYFDPYLRTQCSHCQEMAELCPQCEGQVLDLKREPITCKSCGAAISDGKAIALRCMNGHVTRALRDEVWSIAPNHWLQKRMARIFGEMGQSWREESDYFHIEGTTLYRLRRGQAQDCQLPQVVQTYINNFWDPVNGQVHAGTGDIILSRSVPLGDLQRMTGAEQPGADQPGSMPRTYGIFDLRLRGGVAVDYTVEASVLGGGSVPPQRLVLPPGRIFQHQLDRILHRAATQEELQSVGEALFDALFPPRIFKLWSQSVGGLADEIGMRIRLRVRPPELMILPWELIFEEEYLGLRLRFPIVRYLDLPDPPKSFGVRPPLRVLVVTSQPRDLRSFDVDAELANIGAALGQQPDRIALDVLGVARRDDLLAKLREGYHVLHYVGHGAFDGREGYLILENAAGRSDPVPALLLGQMVADSNLRLAVLNACETSSMGQDRDLGGVAHQLVKGGIPAVVAMQSTIPDSSAIAFSRQFYGALAGGWPVDAAVQEGRRGIMTTLGSEWAGFADWAIPTLYMRATDGAILEAQERGASSRRAERDTPRRVVEQKTSFHGPVHGPVHTGSGDVQVGSLQYGLDADNLADLFEALRSLIEKEAPSAKRNKAVKKAGALQKAVQADEPDLNRMESVLEWFRTNVPPLAGVVVSVILHPLVGKVVEAAGELVAEEFKRRFRKYRAFA